MNSVPTTKGGGAAEPTPPGDFEQALNRLEELVRQMESGNLSLDQMIARFEEGMKLAKFCDEKLNEVERKIEMLVQQGDKISTVSFEPARENGRE